MNTAVTPISNGLLAWLDRAFFGSSSPNALEHSSADSRLPSAEDPALAGVEVTNLAEAEASTNGSAILSETTRPPSKSHRVIPTGDIGNRISNRRSPRNFEPGDLTQLAALSAMLRIEDKTTLVTEGQLIALLSSPSAAESYAKELVRRLALIDTERKINTVVGVGVGMLFANAIARALENMYQGQDPLCTVSVLPVEMEGEGYKLSYAATKNFVGGSKYIILAMPVVMSNSWREIEAIDSLIKSHQTVPSGIARLATVIQYETPPTEVEPDRSKRLPVTRLMKQIFD